MCKISAIGIGQGDGGVAHAGVLMLDARSTDEVIGEALLARESSDRALSEALWDCSERQYYRMYGYRTIQAYLLGRFTDEDRQMPANLTARTVNQFIRAHRVARKIPVFAEQFDQIPRSKRWIIAPILTEENAKEWIALARTSISVRDLEERVKQYVDETAPPELRQRRVIRLFPSQLDVYQRALDLAAQILLEDRKEPGEEGDQVELLAAEFLATYGSAAKLFTGRECPACGPGARLQRMEQEDAEQENATISERRVILLGCSRCSATVVLTYLPGGDDGQAGGVSGPAQ